MRIECRRMPKTSWLLVDRVCTGRRVKNENPPPLRESGKLEREGKHNPNRFEVQVRTRDVAWLVFWELVTFLRSPTPQTTSKTQTKPCCL